MNDRDSGRGKRIDNDEWVEGYILGGCYLYARSAVYLLDPETVGQCTGLKDKNEQLIFEGDVLYKEGTHFIARWKDDAGGFAAYNRSEMPCNLFGVLNYPMGGRGYPDKIANNVKILGNIYDNPELMEEI